MEKEPIVRTYAAMTAQLDALKISYEKNELSKEEYASQKSILEQKMYDYKYKKATNYKDLAKKIGFLVGEGLFRTLLCLLLLIAITLTILPLHKFALIFLGVIAIVAVVRYFLCKKKNERRFMLITLILAVVVSLVAIGKICFTADNKVIEDKQFEQKIQQSQQQDLQDLENLEELDNL